MVQTYSLVSNFTLRRKFIFNSFVRKFDLNLIQLRMCNESVLIEFVLDAYTVHFNLAHNQLGCIHEILWFLLNTSNCKQPTVAAFLKFGLIQKFLQSSKRIRSELQFAPTYSLIKYNGQRTKSQAVQELVKNLPRPHVLWICSQA